MEHNTYLPIGSIVLLKENNKRMMITGRRVISQSENTEYDYQGCVYPEGAAGNDNVILFNNSDITMIYFIGFQDIEELAFRKMILEKTDSEQEA